MKAKNAPARLILMAAAFLLFNCSQNSTKKENTGQELFSGFQNPAAEARPFVRWWWNGNHLQKEEIARQLDVLHEAGIGGVEINPIAMPEEARDIGTRPLTWISKEWNEMVKFASLQAQQRGMIADLIVGSGWPFGGEFLSEDETIQRVIVHKIPCSGGMQINEDLESLYKKAVAGLSHSHGTAGSYEMAFIRLVPEGIRSPSEIIDLEGEYKNNQLNVKVPSGEFLLTYGILQRSNRTVMHGAPGASGPVMNHYEREITRDYLNRLNKISKDTGTPLSELIRALFCDSIELDGANWTDGFGALFFKTYHYRLEPWFPFVFYDPYSGYAEENYAPEFADQLKRVRFDYNKLLVEAFLDNFTQEFQNFCTEKGLLCRYQAYGTPFLMGMTNGNMITDIPESNNWIYSADMDAEAWTWNQGHGYMIWNMYAAAGGHLTGKKIISNEAMTNTRGVFKASLEEIKQHDDMNFITGMNHSVLHGFNYSPTEAGFPGWVRYGTYFSEQNTWWPWFSRWAEYNARLSWVFQNTQPVKSIAILAPEGDLWSNYGLTRHPFHTRPWYCHRLWESLSQAGSSCDYIGRRIIREGTKKQGSLNYGPMKYQTIFLAGVKSLEVETARALLAFVENGGKVVAIDETPDRSLSFQNASENDAVVKEVFARMKNSHSDRFFAVSPPESEEQLLSWTLNLLDKINAPRDVQISAPDKNVYQIRKKADNKEIWFFTNSGRVNTASFKAIFPTGEKTPWIWNPENGARSVFPFKNKKNELNITLQPLESLLLIFEPELEEAPPPQKEKKPGKKIMTVGGPWDVSFAHVNGETFKRNFEALEEFGTSPDPELNSFAGTVTYSASFITNAAVKWLRMEKVNKGITEVSLNGKNVGLNWYGPALFNIENAVQKGENFLEVKYTTVLSNYVMSMKNNSTAQKWTAGYKKIPAGPEGEVSLFASAGAADQ